MRRRVAGRDHFLSLDPAPMDGVAAWIERERAAWTTRLDKLEALARRPFYLQFADWRGCWHHTLQFSYWR